MMMSRSSGEGEKKDSGNGNISAATSSSSSSLPLRGGAADDMVVSATMVDTSSSSGQVVEEESLVSFVTSGYRPQLTSSLNTHSGGGGGSGSVTFSAPAEELEEENNDDIGQSWRSEAFRLSQRIMELEIENVTLRNVLKATLDKSDLQLSPSKKALLQRRRSQQSSLLKPNVGSSHHPSEPPNLSRRVSPSIKSSWSVNGLEDLVSKYGGGKDKVRGPIQALYATAKQEQIAKTTNKPKTIVAATTALPAVSKTTAANDDDYFLQDVEESNKMLEQEEEEECPDVVYEPRIKGDVSFWTGTWNMGAVDPFSDYKGTFDEQKSNLILSSLITHGYDVYVLGVQECVTENVYHAVESFLNRNPKNVRYFRRKFRNRDFKLPDKNYPSDAVLDNVRGRGDGALMGSKFTGLAVFVSASVSHCVEIIRASTHKFNITSGSKGGVAVALSVADNATVVFVNCHLDAKNDANRREQIRTLNSHLGKSIGHLNFDLALQFHHCVWMGDLNYRIHTLDGLEVLDMLGAGKNSELHDKYDGLLADRQNGIFTGFIEPVKARDFYPTYKKFEHRGFVSEDEESWPSQVYRVKYKEPFYKGGQVKARVPGWCDRILVHTIPDLLHTELRPERTKKLNGEWSHNYRSINGGVGMDVSDHSPVTCTFLLRRLEEKDSLENEDDSSIRKKVRSRSVENLKAALDDTDAAAAAELTGDSVHQSQERKRHSGEPASSSSSHHTTNDRLSLQVSTDHPICNAPSSSFYHPASSVLRVFNVMLHWGHDNHIVPRKVRVVTPLVGEADVQKHCDSIGERTTLSNGSFSLQTNLVVQHTIPLRKLHMLLNVRHESISGQCVIALHGLDNKCGKDVRYQMSLTSQSMHVVHEGHPVFISCTIRAKVFSK